MSLLTVDWPEEKFGLPQMESYTLKRQTNLLRTDMASGHVRQRRISRQVPTLMTAEWLLESDLRDDFIGFIDYALQGGVVWFRMPVLVGKALRLHDCRFLTHPADDETPGPMLTRFQSTIEVRQVYRSDDERIVSVILAPNTLDDCVAGTNDAMNSYYTASWKDDQ
ncbi:hypothetical protein [Ferrimonas pelagia]|uniref:Uncharacterized protein n=1 Tax=Ferrimonas pelagia TaxID=1177826 RepID=A0ABP9EKW0_9GAMM